MSDFDKHKKTLEDFLQNIDFIYSGDVISSFDKRLTKKLKHSSFSAVLFRDLMIDIYNDSIKSMMDKSVEMVINRNSFTDIYELIDKISLNPKIIFYSKNSNLNLNLGGNVLDSDDGHGYLPDYFIRRFKMMSHNKEASAYYCPNIEDDIDDCHFYLVDGAIQSMVWSLQNMSYSVNRGFSLNEHTIKYSVYNCDFNSVKIRVVNTQKLREDKINSILDDN